MIDFNRVEKANVYLRDRKAAELRKTSEGFEFQYRGEYLVRSDVLPISKTLSLRKEKYFSKELFPFFDNMILEGWLLNVSEKTLHIDKTDRFALLVATGLDTIGAITVRGIIDGEEIDEKMIMSILPEMKLTQYEMTNPFDEKVCPYTLEDKNEFPNYASLFAKKLWGFDGLPEILLQPDDKYYAFTMTISGGSISGAQRKGLFTLDKKSKTLKPGGLSTTHIIKPKGDFQELPENEHLTMSIARKAGFDVPAIGLFNVEELGNIYVIKRFDRTSNDKLMMEDMAQLLEIESDRKYKTSYEKIEMAIEKFSEGAKIQLAEFFRRLVFCFITANGDMHAKNWALLETTKFKGNYILSPVYDFLNTRLPIPAENDEIAVPLFGKQSNMKASYFREFGIDRLLLPKKYVNSVFDEIPDWQKFINEFTPRSALSEQSKVKYLEICNERVKRFLNTV